MVCDIGELVDSIKSTINKKFPSFGTFQVGLPHSEIRKFESEYQIKLPDEVVSYLQLVNGETPYDKENLFQLGVFLGLEMLSLDEIKREMNVWKEVVRDNPDFADDKYESAPEGAVKEVYCEPNFWVGLATDGCGNSIGVDLSPEPNGKYGQVIIWGRDYIDERIVIFSNWAEFLKQVINDLNRDGEFYKIEDNSFEFLDEQVGNYMDYLFEKKLKEYHNK